MPDTVTISMSLTPQLLKRLNSYVDTGRVQNRSEAIRRALDKFLDEEE